MDTATGEANLREVWLVSCLPPPVHGVSAFNQSLIDWLRAHDVEVKVVRVGTRGPLNDLQTVTMAKALDDARALAGLISQSARAKLRGRPGSRVLYFTPSQGGASVLRDLAVATAGRVTFDRVVAHVHGCGWLDRWSRGGWQARAMEQTLARCDAVVCLGAGYAAKMKAATGFPCVGIDNGVPPPRAAYPRRPRTSGLVELLFLSNPARAKGIWIAAQALRSLVRRGIASRLRCAGEWFSAVEQRQFQADFAPEIRAGQLELLGFADEEAKAGLLTDADFMLLPISYPFEGQPLVLVEAMSRGLVPLTTPQGAIMDLLGDAGTGLCSRDHLDPTRLADAIQRLLCDPEAYLAASTACLRRYQEGLTFERSATAILATLASQAQRLIEPPRRARPLPAG